ELGYEEAAGGIGRDVERVLERRRQRRSLDRVRVLVRPGDGHERAVRLERPDEHVVEVVDEETSVRVPRERGRVEEPRVVRGAVLAVEAELTRARDRADHS